MFSGYLNLPLPPPWRRIYTKVAGNDVKIVHYLNDITKDVTDVHPFTRLISKLQPGNNDDSSKADLNDRDTPSATRARESFNLQPETRSEFTGTYTSGALWEKYFEYRCHWKELGLFEDKNIFGLTIRFIINDERTIVRLDGQNVEWEYVVLEGPYGPATRHDLFIGSKIKVYGRNLVIRAANRDACQWIDREYKRIVRQQDSMQMRIEKCGLIPVVQRVYAPPTLINTRGGPGQGGRCDLSRVRRENSRLGEQLVTIGLAMETG
jgi:hypothetical protein